jgi:Ni,Fe-hydrogenase maturation factor
MKVYTFGNEDLKEDNVAFKVAKILKGKIKEVEFIKVKLNEDLPFTATEKIVVILDVIEGIDKVVELGDKDLDRLVVSKSSTVHDFDLGFQLKYLRKIGKLGEVIIIGLPMQESKIDYFLIQSILRKLVAQDIQGS